MTPQKKFIKKILSKDPRLLLISNNIISAIKGDFSIFLPLLDNENFFYIYSIEWKRALYSSKTNLNILFENYEKYIFKSSNTKFFKDLYQKEILKYICIFKNFIENRKYIDISKELCVSDFYTQEEKKYGYYKTEIRIDGENKNILSLLINFEKNSRSMKNFFIEEYKTELEILKWNSQFSIEA